MNRDYLNLLLPQTNGLLLGSITVFSSKCPDGFRELLLCKRVGL